MGVPGFFKWLVQRMQDVQQWTAPQAIHCLYVDLNGLVHPCCHPEDKPPPPTEEKMMEAIFAELDRVMALAKPQRLLFLALDGVAPRAKMNQQRGRRFLAIHDKQLMKECAEDTTEEWKQHGVKVPKIPPSWDHNVITPGTPFMQLLARSVRFYVQQRISSDPAFKDLVVLVSDSNECGEGEHKIIQFIKRQRQLPNYDPNTSHCIVGDDADLIQLGLCTHEPHMYLLRTCRGGWVCPDDGTHCQPVQKVCPKCNHKKAPAGNTLYSFLCLPRVRSYFRACLHPILSHPTGATANVERLFDDLLLLFIFLGNDFLPHLPSMSLHDESLGRALRCFCNLWELQPGYIVINGTVDLDRLQLLLNALSEEFFGNPKVIRPQISRMTSGLGWARQQHQQELGRLLPGIASGQTVYKALQKATVDIKVKVFKTIVAHKASINRQEAALKEARESTICVGTPDWTDRWVKERWALEPDATAEEKETFRQTVSREYLRGVLWVVGYYYHQCPSWDWGYPYHYAPPLSYLQANDVRGCTFEVGGQFTPFQQLMSVCPPATASLVLPPRLHALMSTELKHQYPDTYHIDYHHCPPPWMAIAEIPFVDQGELLAAVRPVEEELCAEDTALRSRNGRKRTLLFVHHQHPLMKQLNLGYKPGKLCTQVQLAIDPLQGVHIGGRCRLRSGSAEFVGKVLPSPLPDVPDLTSQSTVCGEYTVEKEGPLASLQHSSDLLAGVILPPEGNFLMTPPLRDWPNWPWSEAGGAEQRQGSPAAGEPPQKRQAVSEVVVGSPPPPPTGGWRRNGKSERTNRPGDDGVRTNVVEGAVALGLLTVEPKLR